MGVAGHGEVEAGLGVMVIIVACSKERVSVWLWHACYQPVACLAWQRPAGMWAHRASGRL